MEVRKFLLEVKHNHKNEYGCVMVFLDIDKEKWDDMESLIDDDDLYQPKGDKSYGKEKEPHVTILYGLHNDIPDKDIEKEILKIKKPSIKFKGVSVFKNEKFDVLKFDVESEDMNELNKKFREFPYTSTYDKYTPHSTIAYLKPNTSEKYLKKIKDTFEIETTHIVYSKADGTKKKYDL
jgi:2'-5' RNA ligase